MCPFLKIDAMSTTGELRAPVTDELTLRRVDADPGFPGASTPHGVRHVDPARRILSETMGVAELDSVRRHEPVMFASPAILAFTENDRVIDPPGGGRTPGGEQ